MKYGFEDEIDALLHYHETSGSNETYTYCPTCRAIACDSHNKTERPESGAFCTGCAVTERFALKRRYFYNENNVEAFREEYAAMPLHEKAVENEYLEAVESVSTSRRSPHSRRLAGCCPLPEFNAKRLFRSDLGAFQSAG